MRSLAEVCGGVFGEGDVCGGKLHAVSLQAAAISIRPSLPIASDETDHLTKIEAPAPAEPKLPASGRN